MRALDSCTVYLVSAIFLFSCTTNDAGKKQSKVVSNTPHKVDTIGVFVDSTKIARSGFNKISLVSVLIDDSISKTSVCFYAKSGADWQLKSSFEDDQSPRDILPPEITDFNNDGYRDVSYIIGTRGRGGNVVMNMLIYSKKGDSLFFVSNSNEFPNLYYNNETKSINSYILTGGIETIFMRLSKDSLKPFASIFQDERRVAVSEYDRVGDSKIIQVDSTNNYEFYARFVNYKPLKVKK